MIRISKIAPAIFISALSCQTLNPSPSFTNGRKETNKSILSKFSSPPTQDKKEDKSLLTTFPFHFSPLQLRDRALCGLLTVASSLPYVAANASMISSTNLDGFYIGNETNNNTLNTQGTDHGACDTVCTVAIIVASFSIIFC